MPAITSHLIGGCLTGPVDFLAVWRGGLAGGWPFTAPLPALLLLLVLLLLLMLLLLLLLAGSMFRALDNLGNKAIYDKKWKFVQYVICDFSAVAHWAHVKQLVWLVWT